LLVKLVIGLSLYSSIATWWILTEPKRLANASQEAYREAVAESMQQIKNSANEQATQFDNGEGARGKVEKVFIPVKEVVHDTKIEYRCVGEYPDGVRWSLSQATAVANAVGRLPTTDHKQTPKPPDQLGGAVGGKRP
jgi:ribonuclease I